MAEDSERSQWMTGGDYAGGEPASVDESTLNQRPAVGAPAINAYGIRETDEFIGPYRIREIIGRGGQATIYRADDRRVGRTVALKVLHRVLGAPADVLLRFRREAELTARLDHPSICPIYEVGFDSVPFIAMKLVEGVTLAQKISAALSGSEFTLQSVAISVDSSATLDGASPPENRPSDATTSSAPARPNRAAILADVRLFEHIARALHVAHEAGIVHRDIKPGNLMIQRDGTPVILDFGLAYEVEHAGPSLSATGQVMGTPAYMAPEQIASGKSRVDRRADVYSLGVTLFNCITLERPFNATTLDGLYRAIASEATPDPRRINPEIPKDLQIVLLKAMEKSPDARFQTALEFAEELRRIRSLEPILTRAVGPVLRHRRWMQRNPGWAVALYGIFLALALAVGVFSVKNAALDRTNTELARKTAEALANAKRAAEESAAKSAALIERTRAIEDFERLADATVFAQAKTAAEELFPVSPELVGRIEAWQAKYADLFGRLAGHAAALERMRESAAPYSESDRAADWPQDASTLAELTTKAEEARAKSAVAKSDEVLAVAAEEAEVRMQEHRRAYLARPRVSADFGDDARTQFKHDVLSKLVVDLRAFTDSKTGVVADVASRLQRSRAIKKLTIDDQAAEWAAARARVAQNPKYDGFRLVEQIGLIPLGPDAKSTLEEFHDTMSGIPPRRDASGKIIVTEDMAMVFVLIPGGTLRMGSERSTNGDGGPNIDPDARIDEAPVHSVRLAPFFLSKYEMTQGQWLRVMGENPSFYQKATGRWDTATLDHPVESVSWPMCRVMLRNIGLVFPTEAQWEYACRAGTSTVFWAGDHADDLEDAANILDEAGARVGIAGTSAPWDDGAAVHAPVGSYAKNPFGLHDMHGNVWEWTADSSNPYALAVDPMTGARPGGAQTVRVCRGGSFFYHAAAARSAARNAVTPEIGVPDLGVRPARVVTLGE